MNMWQNKIRKNLLKGLILVNVMLVLSFCLYGCNRNNSGVVVHTIRNIGTFSGYRVDYARLEYSDAQVNAVEVKYYVDDVYISTCSDPSYKYLVYTSEKDYVTLISAYEQNLVTYDDLLAIAEAEKPYDNLYNEGTDGPR